MNRIALMALSSFALIAGCESNPSKVSKDDLASLQETYQQDVSVGMSMAQVKSVMTKGAFNRVSSTMFQGARVEEWKYEAYHDDDWSKTRDLFVNFLYFVDDALVQMSRERVKYQDNADVLGQWLEHKPETASGG